MKKFLKTNNNSEHNIQESFDKVLRDANNFYSLPVSLQKSSDFLSLILAHYPTLFQEIKKKFIEKEKEILKAIITEPIPSLGNHPFETLSLAHDKIKDREFCLEMVNINPFNIKHVPSKYLYDSEFIETALKGDGLTIRYMPSYVKENEDFGLIAVKSNGFSLKFFSPNVISSREVLLTALDTKGFSLSHFDNPEEICCDPEIAEKALKSDINALKFFTPENPLIRDKYFAIKMIPFNAKIFALFDQEIRHDPDTLLQIVKNKSVEQILYIVSQEFNLYPKFFLFALDAYQKCLTDEEKEENYGFYYYLHTALFKERQKKFNIMYRKNIEKQKEIEAQHAAIEEENRKKAQEYIYQLNEAEGSQQQEQDIQDNTDSITNTTISNQQPNIRGHKKYNIQTAKDFAVNINDVTLSKNNDGSEDDDFSHLAMLADEIIDDINISDSAINNKDDLSEVLIEETINSQSTAENFSTYIYDKPVVENKDSSSEEDINQKNNSPSKIYNNDLLSNQHQSIDDKIEPLFEDNLDDLNISPAQNAARRAFGERRKNNMPTIKDENDYIHKPVKKETTKKGSISIFNFQK